MRTNHATSDGLWLKIAKKGTGVTTVDIVDAIEVALCYGWIDGLRHKHDDVTEAGRMQPAGQAQVDAAKADGRWAAAALDSTNRYAILFRIHDAKRPETRARRIEQFVTMLAEGRTIH